MQYVGQTGRSLKTRFREHFPKMKKPKKMTHFFVAGHSLSKIVIQLVDKIIYDQNSATRLKNIKTHETEIKWIKFCNHLFCWALMIKFSMKVTFLKCQILMFFSVFGM